VCIALFVGIMGKYCNQIVLCVGSWTALLLYLYKRRIGLPCDSEVLRLSLEVMSQICGHIGGDTRQFDRPFA
jgi:hypothetical protein